MKRVVAGIGLCVACVSAVSAQMPKYGVTVNAEKNVDFSKFKTYTWTPGQPSMNKSVDAAIMAAVDRELVALGMTKAPSGSGDVQVAYYSLSRTDVDLKSKRGADGQLRQYWVGTLVVGLLEPTSRRRLLRLRIDKPLETEPDKLQATIDTAVNELFSEYPTRRRR
jgi:Domain of unknown function (DUF4136)